MIYLEAESELVSGYNVEYTGGSFALYFLGEYSSIIMMSSLMVCLFMGSYSTMLTGIVVFLIVSLFIWLRAAYSTL